MKKRTGLLLVFTFFLIVLFMIGIFVTLIVYSIRGSSVNLLGADRLALVRVEGLIYDAEEWLDQIEEYQKDSSIRGIVLRVDSGGGAVSPSQDLHRAIVETREDYGKVVVVSFGSIAASGGYYIACGADRILTSPGTLTGSIGVYAKFLETKELFEKIGIDYETIKAGKYKTVGSIEREMTEEERTMMQSVIDDTYLQFVEAVAEGRKENMIRLLQHWKSTKTTPEYPFTPDVVEIIRNYQDRIAQLAQIHNAAPIIPAATEIQSGTETTSNPEIANPTAQERFLPSHDVILSLVKTLADGKIYTGRQAKEIALIDDIGSLEDAIQTAAGLVGIRGRPKVIERRKREYSWLDLLSQKLSTLTGQKFPSPIQYRFPY
jgi:protease-4